MRFKIFRELDDGELVLVATHRTKDEAQRQLEAFEEQWPGVYFIEAEVAEQDDPD